MRTGWRRRWARWRQPHRRPHRLAARVGEADHVDSGDRPDDLPGRLDLQLVRQPEAGAEVGDGRGHGAGDGRVPVAEDHRPQAEQVVDVGVPVDVAQPRAAALGHERGIRLPPELDGPGAAAGAAGDVPAGLVEERVGAP